MACVGTLRTFGAPVPLTLGVRPMQSSVYQRASRLHELYAELRALLAAERGDEWLRHIDPIVSALALPF